MSPSEPRRSLLAAARDSWQRSAVQRLIRSAAMSDGESFAIDVDEIGAEGVELVCETAGRLAPGSPGLRRLETAFARTGSVDRIVARLSGPDRLLQVQGLRLIGALRIDAATMWVVPMLDAEDQAVRDAAARALGRIGGSGCAEALLGVVERRGAGRVVVTALARCAPDQLLEIEIKRSRHQQVRLAAVMAAGLRGRRAAVGPLIGLLGAGTARERIAACRALGWIGSATAIAAVRVAQSDVEPAVRAAAGKALRALLSRSAAALGTATRPLGAV